MTHLSDPDKYHIEWKLVFLLKFFFYISLYSIHKSKASFSHIQIIPFLREPQIAFLSIATSLHLVHPLYESIMNILSKHDPLSLLPRPQQKSLRALHHHCMFSAAVRLHSYDIRIFRVSYSEQHNEHTLIPTQSPTSKI